MTLDPRWTLSFAGDFFEKDVSATLAANAHKMMEALAKEGEQDVRDHFPVGGDGDPHPGLGQQGVVGRVSSISGKLWRFSAVISQQNVYPWGQRAAVLTKMTGRGKNKRINGYISSGNEQYRGGKLEAKLHMFANTSRRISSMRSVLAADLTAGLDS
jgi:hypothetical protein